MCTLTYIPNANGFILTSNRDESVQRMSALPPEEHVVHGHRVYFPKDAEANGTWIATEEGGHTLCLLNGAFGYHLPMPPYRISRGIVLLDFYKLNDAQQFKDNYKLKNVEPFTLIIIPPGGKDIKELRWNGERKYFDRCDPKKHHIWSSTTLYSPYVIWQREQMFKKLLEKCPSPTAEQIFDFHRFGGNGNEANEFRISKHGGLVETVSITSVIAEGDKRKMKYLSLEKV